VEELEEAVVTKERRLEEAAARESALRAELDATRAANNSATSAIGGGGGGGSGEAEAEAKAEAGAGAAVWRRRAEADAEAEAWRRRVEAAEAEAEVWRHRVEETEAEAAAREAALRADLHTSRADAANNASSPMEEAVAEAWLGLADIASHFIDTHLEPSSLESYGALCYGEQCPPGHLEPSSLESHGTLCVGSNVH